MLLTNRRHRLIFVFLAGMEVAWFLPYALTLAARWQPDMAVNAAAATAQLNRLFVLAPILLVGVFWAIMLLYLLVADWLNRRLIDSPGRELIVLGAVLLTTLLGIRLFFYPAVPLLDGSWLRGTLGAIFNFTEGRRPELAFVLVNLFLWLRVVFASGREITFFGIGVSFRLGVLLALLGNGLLVGPGGRPPAIAMQYFWIFFGCGLLAVALARIDEKSLVGEHSTGAVLPWPRFVQIGAVTALFLGAGAWLATIYTPPAIRTVLFGWLAPLWTVLGLILARVVLLLAWVLAPLMNWLVETIRRWMENAEFLQPPTDQGAPAYEDLSPDDFFSMADALREWDWFRYGVIAGVIVIGALLLLLLYVRTRTRTLRDEAEEAERGDVDLGGDALRRGLERLRDLANLVRRFGLSTQLLDAISVQNMYANLSRIARQRGHPRRANQPPDEYLPELTNAFPTEPAALAQMTNAYMRVHYGDQRIESAELSRLRAAYERVKESPASLHEESV